MLRLRSGKGFHLEKIKSFMKGPGLILVAAAVVISGGLYVFNRISGRSPINVMGTLRKTGVLKIGVPTDFPPLGYYDVEGNQSGFEVELARAMGERIMGEGGALLIEVTPKTRGAYLDQSKVDVLISSVNKSETNMSNYNMGEVYLEDDIMFLCASNAEIDLSSEDMVVGVIGNSAAKTVLTAYMEADPELKAQVVDVPSHPEALEMLDSMEIDFYCNERTTLNNKLKTGYKITSPVIGTLSYAYACRLREKDLADELDAAYAELKRNGTLKELYMKYNLTPPGN